MIFIPSQTEHPKNLREEGPIVEVILSVPDMLRKRLIQENLDVPEPQKVRALIDTGASDSFIDSEITEKLKLNPINVKPVQIDTGSDSKVTNTYFIRAEFPKLFRILEEEFAELKNLKERFSYKAIIGRDILSNGFLIYNQEHNKFTFGLKN